MLSEGEGKCKTQQEPESRQPRGNAKVGARGMCRRGILSRWLLPSWMLWVTLGEEGDTSFSSTYLWIPAGCSPAPLNRDFGEQSSLCPGCVSHCPDTVTNTDSSGTALLGRNFGDFSFHGLITAFFVFLLVSFSLPVLQVGP